MMGREVKPSKTKMLVWSISLFVFCLMISLAAYEPGELGRSLFLFFAPILMLFLMFRSAFKEKLILLENEIWHVKSDYTEKYKLSRIESVEVCWGKPYHLDVKYNDTDKIDSIMFDYLHEGLIEFPKWAEQQSEGRIKIKMLPKLEKKFVFWMGDYGILFPFWLIAATAFYFRVWSNLSNCFQ